MHLKSVKAWWLLTQCGIIFLFCQKCHSHPSHHRGGVSGWVSITSFWHPPPHTPSVVLYCLQNGSLMRQTVNPYFELLTPCSYYTVSGAQETEKLWEEHSLFNYCLLGKTSSFPILLVHLSFSLECLKRERGRQGIMG